MNITYFTSEHYSELELWWKHYNHKVISITSLPVGVVVSTQEKILAMSFLYTMNGCDVAQIAWTTSNPKNKLRESHEAVTTAIDALLVLAKKLNKNTITCFSGSKGMSKILNRRNIAQNKNHVLHIGSF